MLTYDIYLSSAIDDVYETLREFYGIKDPNFKDLINHPARDDLIINALQTPFFTSIQTGQEVELRVWIRKSHKEVWSINIQNSIAYRLNSQSLGEGISFTINTLVYPT